MNLLGKMLLGGVGLLLLIIGIFTVILPMIFGGGFEETSGAIVNDLNTEVTWQQNWSVADDLLDEEQYHTGHQGGYWVHTSYIHGNTVGISINFPAVDVCHGGQSQYDVGTILSDYPELEDIYWEAYENGQVEDDRRITIYTATGDMTMGNVTEGQDRTTAIDDLTQNGEFTCGPHISPN